MKVAVIGAGGAGLTTAWLLDGSHEVTLYEQADRLGGHADTIPVEVAGKTVAVDAGFEFISEAMFPTFVRLLRALGVALEPYPMLVTMFNTRTGASYLMPPFHGWQIFPEGWAPRTLADLLRFARILRAVEPIMRTRDTSVTAEDFLRQLRAPADFCDRFMYPFLQASWGVSREEIQTFAAYDIFKYSYLNTPATLIPRGWKEIVGGTQTYVQAVARSFATVKVRLGTGVAAIERAEEDSPSGAGARYRVRDQQGGVEEYDHVALATNANQAAATLAPLEGDEVIERMRDCLNGFSYFETTIAIHGDTRLMPPRRSRWSTVNIRHDGVFSQCSMWRGQKSGVDVFKSWVTHDATLPEPLYATARYLHPRVDLNYFALQKRLQAMQGPRNLSLAGMYMEDVDCHESVVLSAINVARRLAPQSTRLRLLMGQSPEQSPEQSAGWAPERMSERTPAQPR